MDYRAMFLTMPLLTNVLHPAHAALAASQSSAPKKSMTAHQPLTLSSFFKPVPKGHRLSSSPVQYTFTGSGTGTKTINYIRICTATDNTCGTCDTNFNFINTGRPINYEAASPGSTYGIPAASVAAYLASQGASSGHYNIGMYLQSSGTDCANNSHCSTSVDTASTPHALCMQATYNATTKSVSGLVQSDNHQASLTTAAPLVASLSNLALKVSGIKRTITITNNSSSAVSSVNFTLSPALPSGSSISPASTCGTISAGGTCVLEITPGLTPTSTPYTTSPVPTPAVLTLTSSANPLYLTLNILDYGSLYQEGYVFSMDNSPPQSESIKGKVVALTDQAAQSPGVIWSSNGSGSASADVSYDIIPGINDLSTPSISNPLYTDFTSMFDSSSGNYTYTNTNPFMSLSFSSCQGDADGQCDSNNIWVFYNYFITN